MRKEPGYDNGLIYQDKTRSSTIWVSQGKAPSGK